MEPDIRRLVRRKPSQDFGAAKHDSRKPPVATRVLGFLFEFADDTIIADDRNATLRRVRYLIEAERRDRLATLVKNRHPAEVCRRKYVRIENPEIRFFLDPVAVRIDRTGRAEQHFLFHYLNIHPALPVSNGSPHLVGMGVEINQDLFDSGSETNLKPDLQQGNSTYGQKALGN